MKEDKAKEYELMVRKVFSQNVAKDWPIKNFKFFHRNRIKGIDSNLYEVDIAFEFEIATSKLLGIIECKNYSRTVGKNIVAEFSTKISQLRANFGLIVSPLGFQKGAVNLAKNMGIKLAKICKYEYIPLVAESKQNYLESIVGYVQEHNVKHSRYAIQSVFSGLGLCPITINKGRDMFQDDTVSYGLHNASANAQIAFELVTGREPVLVDSKNLFLIMYGESLLTTSK